MEMTAEVSWAFHELIRSDLGDTRLNDRLIRLVDAVAAKPGASLTEACDKAGTKAAYRFFDNERIEAAKILAPHAERTVERAAKHDVVLAIQDTTTWSLSGRPATAGLGHVGGVKGAKGLLVHSTMIVSPNGHPLGVLDQQVWARMKSGTRKKAHQTPIDQKETRCWLKGLDAVQKALPNHPKVVVVGDRESDIFDLFQFPRRPNVQLLVRVGPEKRLVDHESRYLQAAVESSPPRGTIRVELPRADGRPARTAVLEVRWASLNVLPPKHHPNHSELSSIRLQFILVEEKDPAQGQKPVRWLLVTTLAIETFEDALRYVTWYTRRWRIERFHFVLKSGCKIEELQLEDADNLTRALACYSIVAWRLLWLTYEARENPDQSCACVLSSHEWQSLCATVRRKQSIPTEPPTLRNAVRMIAELGGFLARKGDGEPGVKTLWRGLRRLDDISQTWQLAQQQRPPIR
jgi:hypothetical protein